MKHLNPRQGITTYLREPDYVADLLQCETPKSPPGDYNIVVAEWRYGDWDERVKHLNPRQGITTGGSSRQFSSPYFFARV